VDDLWVVEEVCQEGAVEEGDLFVKLWRREDGNYRECSMAAWMAEQPSKRVMGGDGR
jgi:hypothetical protein